MRKKQVLVNIKIAFGSEIFHLKDCKSRAKSEKSSVEIYMKMRPGNEVQPMAVIPDGTLEKYKHCRPRVISWDWAYE